MYSKNLLLLLVVSLWGLAYQPALGQSTEKAPADTNRIPLTGYNFTMIKTNPLVVLWGAIPFTSEYRLTYSTGTGNNQYVCISGAYLGRNILLFSDNRVIGHPGAHNFHFKGFKTDFSYRWIISSWSNNMPSGLYIGTHISYAHLRIEHDNLNGLTEHAFVEHIHATGIMGVKGRLFDVFYLDLFAGMGYKTNQWGNHVMQYSPPLLDLSALTWVYNSNFKLKAGFSLGIRIE